MFCKICSNKIKKNDLFCTNCGAKIKNNFKSLYIAIVIIIAIAVFSLTLWTIYDSYVFKSKNYCDYFNENIGGIGVTIVENKDKKIIIKNTLKNFPAEKAGLKENDEILNINNKIVNDYQSAMKELRGNKNTNLKITIKRNGEKLKFRLTRASILTEPGYFQIINKVQLRQDYLKYDNGKYYFWLKILPGSPLLANNPQIKYTTELFVIDLLNQKIAIPEYYVYDKKGNIIDSQSNDEKDTKYAAIVPDTVGYILLQLVKEIDDDIPNRYKKD